MKARSTHCGRLADAVTRRDFLSRTALGFGTLAIGDLLARDAAAGGIGEAAGGVADALAMRPPHFPAKAKNVIFLFMTGGPSHLETFDPKPELKRYDGQPLPESFNADGIALQFMKPSDGKLMASTFPFTRHGQSGLEISSLFPQLSRHADRLAVIRSCHHESFIHGPAITNMTTGSLLLGHPSVGAWVTYGLGCESRDLPAYMVLTDAGFRGGNVMYQSGFFAGRVPGNVAARQRSPDSEPGSAAQISRRAAAGPARLRASLERALRRGPPGRQPARGADLELRAGLPDADRGPRADAADRRNGRLPGGLWRRSRADGPLRPHVPVGPADGRTGRAHSCY